MQKDEAVEKARRYYNSDGAERFYSTFWGGEDIHIGVYETDREPIRQASRRTVERMALGIELGPEHRVLDIGAGYGGSARYLSRTYGAATVCLNLSEVQNERNRRLNRDQGLSELVSVVEGNFEALPFEEGSFDLVWSQDAMLHSERRGTILEEVARILKPGGRFVFTDPMQADGGDATLLAPVLERLDLDSLASPGFYREEAERLGFSLEAFDNLSPHLSHHYASVLRVLEENDAEARRISGDEYVGRMKRGLENWVKAGNAGALVWGIFRFRKAGV